MHRPLLIGTLAAALALAGCNRDAASPEANGQPAPAQGSTGAAAQEDRSTSVKTSASATGDATS